MLLTSSLGVSSSRLTPSELTPNDEVNNIKCSVTDLIFTNTKIIDKSNHWSLILYHHGTKASKDLLIFN
jgi:hypothetical protein